MSNLASTNINERVFAAFRVEHREHLEAIRSVLGSLEDGICRADDPRINEAFRTAHSLKGGARVCDLRVVETLGHQLESLFAAVREGRISMHDDVRCTVTTVLDAIEDLVAAASAGEENRCEQEVLTLIEKLMSRAGLQESGPQLAGAEAARAQVLRAVFAEEYRDYANALNEFVHSVPRNLPPDKASVLEAFRLAHSLRSAANAADLPEVEAVGAHLEEAIGSLRDAKHALSDELAEQMLHLLETADAAIAAEPRAAPLAPAACDPADQEKQPDAEPRDNSPPDAEHAKRESSSRWQMETVRVQAESLDKLVRSSGHLLTAVSLQEDIKRELVAFNRQLEVLLKERSFLRRAESAVHGCHRHGDEHQRSSRRSYLAEQQLEALGRSARRLLQLQQRSAWTLMHRGAEIHNFARQIRTIPAENVFQGFRKLVRDLARDEGKNLRFVCRGLEHPADRLVLQALKDPLMHVLRNAVVHGIETPAERAALGKTPEGTVELTIESVGNRLRIRVTDDGRGLDREAIARRARELGAGIPADDTAKPSDLTNLLFRPGFSTSADVSELAGRGMGLSVVQEVVTRLQGSVVLDTPAAAGTQVVITVPVSISSQRLLLVDAGARRYALPVASVEQLLRVSTDELSLLEGTLVLHYKKQPIPVYSLRALLNSQEPGPANDGGKLSLAVLRCPGGMFAVEVDEFVGERDALVQDLTGPAARDSRFVGAMLLESGTVALVLDAQAMFQRSASTTAVTNVAPAPLRPDKRTLSVLVVDDSFTTRTLEKSILEAHGYDVHIAVDGVEAISTLCTQAIDLIISDVEMPRMNGFELLESVRKDARFSNVPLILVTSRDRADDRQKGLELGANAYIVKQRFDHEHLLQVIQQTI